ncbi:serine hydrolase [Vogesella alkaliphila]|uniref:D-alanyl-D-alanine carboxypeptidase n=1 Tax=Vogesella alkaliphila TaxID=1193621 RepID=A0ABQ2YCK2_9NEIS|nr:serine hydrolase [Vogesella alkaliphila]GGX79232.1 D-alanyl-D-alanine carboxypeptidase [Vogesella alkaliphila]
MLKNLFVACVLALGSGAIMAAQPTSYHPSEATQPQLSSHSVAIVDGRTGQMVFEKNARQKLPIASITKLMTAMVVLDAGLPLDTPMTIGEEEIDRLKNTGSRLAVGSTLTRREMLLLALMSSENRAAAVLSRYYPGGRPAFIERMNQKARAIGMQNASFYDSTGLDVRNSATAMDLVRMVKAANQYPLIRQFTTMTEYTAQPTATRTLHYKNSNALVREGQWAIELSKTGFINEAGGCLVMEAEVGSQKLVFVLLAANSTAARVRDARSIKTWLESIPHTWLAG